MEELWIDIKNVSRYRVSNLGRVSSKRRETKCNTGKVIRKERIMTPQIRNGYYSVRLKNNDDVIKNYSIHRLVAEAFIENPENKPTVDHINRDKLDNTLENLRWATYSEQQLNKVVSGTDKIPIKAIDRLGNEYLYDSIKNASISLGVDNGTISKVLSDKHSNKTGGGYYFERI